MTKNGKEGESIVSRWKKINDNFLKNNLKIIPIQANSKIPLLPDWRNECSCDCLQVVYWNEQCRNCNWGLPCYENNLFVIDLDRHDVEKDGVDNFQKLCEQLGITVETMTQVTPSGGVHLIFQSNEVLKQVEGVSNAFKDYPGIDLRNRNYIVVEPSIINGKEYKFANNLPPMQMPVVLQQYILDNVGTKEEKKKSQYTKPKEVFIGNRDTALFEYINNIYYKTRLDYDEVLTLAYKFNNEVLEEAFPDKVVEYKTKKCFQKDRGVCVYVWLGDSDEKTEDN